MSTSEQQILDLRYCHAQLHAPGCHGEPAGSPIALQLSGPGEAHWVQAAADAIEGLPMAAAPVCLWLPLGLFLFRTVRVPETGERRRLQLLNLEVERLFPHDASTLLWCHTTLSQHELDRQILIAAMHRNSFVLLAERLYQRGLTAVSGLPSLFLALKSCPPADPSLDAQWLISMEPPDICVLCRWPGGAMVRRVVFDVNDTPSGGDPSSVAGTPRLGREFRRVAAELQRQDQGIQRIGLQWFGEAELERQSFVEAMALEGIGVERVSEQALIKSGFEALHDNLPSVETGELLRVTDPNSASNPKPQHSRWRTVRSLCMALAPLLWVAGNSERTAELRFELAALNAQRESEQMRAQSADRLRAQLEVEWEAFDRNRQEHAQQQSLLGLFADLQDAILAVGDSWFECFEWQVPRVGEPGTVQLCGKFLLRNTSLDHTQAAIAHAEQKLHLLQERVTASPQVAAIKQFRVSYSGIHHDIHVIPFEMEITLIHPVFPSASPREEPS